MVFLWFSHGFHAIGDAITQVNHITVYEYSGDIQYIYIYINNGDYMGIFILTVYRLLTI